ncbi:MAG: threo-3-hydroxy-L-aspartate ammonia-lyase [Ignavibacteriaceae bacterium]|nr:threo-3-hydroxy-L-aspartate ammonia-lyase [Ignavibacteriaceae bacterium]
MQVMLFAKIEEARSRLKGIAHQTPVLTSSTLDKIVGSKVFLKCENFQRMGAFKFRGAFNAISQLSEKEKRLGVVTYSSGNHAQAVALVGKLLNVNTIVVMPKNSPKTKMAAAQEYGAQVILYDPEISVREEVAEKLIEQNGYKLIPPFDHVDIIAGQGTASLELFEQIGDLDYVLSPCGGGGLLSGTAIASKGKNPACKVIGIEPELADDAAKSFYSKTLHTVKNPKTIADGTRTASLGKITFPLILEYVDEMKTVSEKEIIEAVKFLFFRMKIVVEPSGALGVAALLNSKVSVDGKVGVIISGGNIDASTMKMILES